MGIVHRFWNWLTGANERRTPAVALDPPALDVAVLATELDLARQAQRLGEAGLPAPDATTLSGPETAALQRVEQVRQAHVDRAVARLAVLNDTLRRADVTSRVQRAAQADREFERGAEALIAGHETLLKPLGEAAARRRIELAEFRSTHGLARDARHPTAAGRVLRGALLAFLVVVEGVLNASFFAQGVDTGLVGGAAYAMALAALNVGVAFAFGRGPVRQVNHRQLPRRLIGLAAIAAALAAMTTVGLGIAHVRDALATGRPDAPALALRALQDAPWQLHDLASWGLLAISLAFGVAALLDGLGADDPYPGYGPMARRAREAADDHEEELDVLREDLAALEQEALDGLDAALQAATGALAAQAAAIDDKRAAALRLATAQRDADHVLDALLQAFRTENQLHRKGVPRPAYFDAPVTLRPLALPDAGTADDEAALARQQAAAQALRDDVAAVRERVRQAASRAATRLAQLGEVEAREGTVVAPPTSSSLPLAEGVTPR